MPRVAILGQGFVGSIFSVGVERIKRGEVALYGVPLRDELPYKVKDIKIVASYDVDESKVGKSVAEVCAHYWGGGIPKSLEKIKIEKGIHLNSLRNLPVKASGLEDEMPLEEAIKRLVESWKEKEVEVIVNVCTTEAFTPFEEREELERAIKEN